MIAKKVSPAHAESGYLPLLRHRNFALFFAASSISELGTAVAQIGLTLALLVMGYSASTVGLVLASETVPMLAFTLAGGVLGDRWSRRHLMIAADLLRCLSQGTLAALLLAGHPPVLVLMLLGAACGVGNAFHRPAASGLIPQIADAAHLQKANSLTSLAGSLSIVIGPAIGGLLVGFGSGVLAIAVDAASYAVSAALLAFVSFPAGVIALQNASFFTELRQGWAEFRRHRWLQLLTAQIALQNALALGLFFVIGPSLFAPLKDGPQDWGVVTACVGAGGMIGGLLVLRLNFARPLLVIQSAIAVMAGPAIMLSLGSPIPLLMLSSGLFGIGMAVTNALFATAMQKSVPVGFLSRVSSFVGLVVMGLTPLGYLLSGPAAKIFGAHDVLATGACALLLSVAVLLLSQEIRFGRPRTGQVSADLA
jgi:MFS family permease